MIILPLPWSKPTLNGNTIRTMHRMKKAALTREIRTHVASDPTLQKCGPVPAVSVAVVWLVNDRRRRDEDNLWPFVKPIYDGIVDAGLVADDAPEYMQKSTPTIVHVPRSVHEAGLFVIIEPLLETENARVASRLLRVLGITEEVI